MAGDFDISYKEADSLGNSYQLFETNLTIALQAIDSAVQQLASLSTLRGAAGESIKRYFEDSHLSLCRALDLAAGRLLVTYLRSFSSQFSKGAIGETHGAARWSNATMKAACRDSNAVVTRHLTVADAELNKVRNALPADCQFSIPSYLNVASHVARQVDLTEKVRCAVADLDAKGCTALKKDDAFSKASDKLGMVLDAWKPSTSSMTSYKSGSFFSTKGYSELKAACLQVRDYQTANKELIFELRTDSLDREMKQLEVEEADAIKQKRYACIGGTIAAVTLLVVGVVATVATAGAGSSVLVLSFSFLDTVHSGIDAYDRADQLNRVLTGDARADRSSGEAYDKQVKKNLGTLEKLEKDGLKIQSAREDYESVDGDAHPRIKSREKRHYEDSIDSLKGTVTEITVDTVAGEIQHEIGEAYGEKSEMESKVAYGTAKGFYQGAKDGFTPSGVFKTVAKSSETVADYYESEADAKLDYIDDRRQSIDDIKQVLGGTKDYAWGAGW